MGVRQGRKILGNQSWSDVLRDSADGGSNGLLVSILSVEG